MKFHEGNMEKKLWVGVFVDKYVIYMLMMDLVLRQSLMLISTTDILLYEKYISPLYNTL